MKAYLGDSVYADTDELGRVVLTTENGLPRDPSNRIVLEPEVLGAFWLWLSTPQHSKPAATKKV